LRSTSENQRNEALKNMMNFSPEFKFQQTTYAYMIHHLTEKSDTYELRKVFLSMDINNDGKLSHDEIINGFKHDLKLLNKTEKELVKVIKKIDQDKSGFIEYEEFIRATINKKNFITEEKMKIVFDLLRTKGETITVADIKSFLGVASKQYSEKAWNEIVSQIIHEVDINRDGEIAYHEFASMMIKLIN
jgi:calcium-dependent protein kinase